MTGRRPYRLGKRAPAVAETRARILRAATEEYAEHGIDSTSMQAVARRADVAPGTVLYHYPTPDDLAAAAVEDWKQRLEIPTAEAVDQTNSLEARIAALVRELFDFYERSEWAYQIYQKSPDHPVLVEANADYEAGFTDLLMAALGDRADDEHTVLVVSALVDADFYGVLASRGLDRSQATELATELVRGWLGRSAR